MRTWMSKNWLELNDDKTALIITTSEITSRQENTVINIDDNNTNKKF